MAMRRARLLPLAATAVVVVALGVAPGAVATPSATTATPPCHAAVRTGILPPWARGGFSSPRPRIPHVLGRSGRIVAVLFGYPLRSPRAPNRANKVLWVSRTTPRTPAALWIRAQRLDGTTPAGTPVEHVVRGGPGPSYVDVPSPGCWRLTLSWSGRRDTLDLAYGAGS